MKRSSRPSLAEARQKAERYCVWQERCHSEVEQKLRSLGLKPDEIADVMHHLVVHGFLNEERFARAFAGGKYRQQGWGRKKIIYHLRAKGINEQLIHTAMSEIPEDEYNHTIQELIEKKDAGFRYPEKSQRMAAMSRYLLQRGFEQELVISEVKKFYGS